jgi:hypothetical protein
MESLLLCALHFLHVFYCGFGAFSPLRRYCYALRECALAGWPHA